MNKHKRRSDVEEQIQRVINCGKMMRNRIKKNQKKRKSLKQIKC